MAEIHYKRHVYARVVEIHKHHYSSWPGLLKELSKDIDRLEQENKISIPCRDDLKQFLVELQSEGVT